VAIKLAGGSSVYSSRVKLILSIGCALIIGAVSGFIFNWKIVPLICWDSTAVIYMLGTWLKVSRYDSALVEQHALREDPSRTTADMVLIGASLVSLGAVFLVLIGAGEAKGLASILLPLLSVFSVVVSWFMIHTIFTLRYAESYYSKPKGGIDFGDTAPPIYSDFAYLAFTIGMTFQVSDSTLKSHQFRVAALKQALLSYVFGTVIIATTINLIAGLAK
jgi:uncharacterized membrane protein